MMIYVDLDNTLIDSVRRANLEVEAGKEYGLSESDYWRAVDMYIERHGVSNFGYDALFRFCKMLKPDLSDTLLAAWNDILQRPYLFPDTHDFLTRFNRNELILLTTGSVDFQMTKIVVHDLEKYFKTILIVASPKAHYVSPPEDSIFIDDSPREIDTMKRMFPHVHCVLIRTPAPWEKQKISTHADRHCENLLGVVTKTMHNE